ncbi:succinate dehydrogenase, hydrophobic membrane anchor protein [Leucothrix mucor]|mgnify:CR=1 FL=1|jgi:succinate dehydrogenase / fumarate reductase membrane anchor subunit|uniref:succinate dehydrogenase, hydrophobic membrane anchor protein n=1 Tax=Leucothrix mucor TaxID=45248 RepID=UPI0003B754F5|nr:succinate dehydrogenase, hydrophobic membrane anchor protein [Leucothrix mucor]
MSYLRSPLSVAKGHGSAKDGTHHFWLQRVTAIALIPLIVWFCLSLAMMPTATYATVVDWMQSPFNSVMLILSIFAAFYHLALGLQVILEDYIANTNIRMFSILGMKLLCFFFAALGIFSVIKIAVGG